MIHLPRYPKVLALGHRVLNQIWDGPVEITEKVDGSQFSFAKVEDELICRTRRTTLYLGAPDKLFLPAIKQCQKVLKEIPEGVIFFAETLARPKHNVLEYGRVPEGHVALFGIMRIEAHDMMYYSDIQYWANEFGMEVVPKLWEGKVAEQWRGHEAEMIIDLLDSPSFLGNTKIEGVVVKNYNHDAMIGDSVYYPYLVGKYVNAEFQEKMSGKKYGRRATKETWETFKDTFRTEARWWKGIQHLREDGSLAVEPKDIGPLMKEIHTDLEDEEKEAVMEFLYKIHRKEFLGRATQGFAEWYKEQLLRGTIDE